MTPDRGSRLNFWLVPGILTGAIFVGFVLAGALAGATGARVAFLLIPMGLWVVALFLWARAEESRLLVARARFPDDVVENALRSKRSITALWMLRPLGFEVLERAPRRWLLVTTSDAVEIWGGPLRRLVRYARLPFSEIVDVEIDRVHDRNQFHHGLIVRVETAGDPWPVPLIVLGGSPFGIGSAGPEYLSGVREAVLVRSTSAGE